MNREPQKENDLFFTCSLIEYIARKTKNTKKEIIEKLGEKNIQKMYDLAEVYHSENIEKIAQEFIEENNIPNGNYDILSFCQGTIPNHFELGRVYSTLILQLASDENEYIKKLIEVLSSWIIEKIDNYNSSMYYERSEYIYECFKAGRIL